MLTVDIQEAIIPEGLAITEHEYHQWQSELEQLELSDATFESCVLKQMLENAAAQCSEIDESEMYISDRRWKKSVKLLKASAYFNGRDEVNHDLLLLKTVTATIS